MDKDLIRVYADKYGRNDAETIARAMAFKDNVASRNEPGNNSKIASLIDAGTREIANGRDFGTRSLEQRTVTEDERNAIVECINQGTGDILAHSDLSPQMAMRLGQLERRVNGQN